MRTFRLILVGIAAAAAAAGAGVTAATASDSKDDAPAGTANIQLTAEDYAQWASAAGYSQHKDPVMAFLADCLRSNGYEAAYDDSTGMTKTEAEVGAAGRCISSLGKGETG